MRNNRKAATLIELITTMTVVAIIAAATAGMVVYLMRVFVDMPTEVKAKSIANDVIALIIDGQSQLRGARYASQVQDATAAQFTYTFGYPGGTDKRNMRFRWDSGNKKIYRSYTAFGDAISGPQPPYGSEEVIPSYATGTSIEGPGSGPSTIFKYYKSDGSQWVQGTDALGTIRRLEITIVATSGTGTFQSTSSVAIRGYE